MTAGRKLSADMVCAYIWERTPEKMRAAVAALASISHLNALLEWYELGEAERIALRRELADLIEVNASAQRREWAKNEEARRSRLSPGRAA